ncbi:hypothetical protein GIB67_040586 [Kingdonia uniflora]|uniref:Peptidase M20 dimerisation domain-containing protein n=1 Tax=Kingdonia uniflora TaxID=39325 RepID=A0A7J7M8W3_9MAGN|nr:hypothetical protein GIB67_040586 [Kingdonia uniflora]
MVSIRDRLKQTKENLVSLLEIHRKPRSKKKATLEMGDSEDRLTKLETKVSDLITILGELGEQLRLTNLATASASASKKRRERTKKKGVTEEERDDVNDEEFDPFSLSTDGDKLRGRGTTDCLGHVALVTELMRKLGETQPKLKSNVVAVFIANEEDSSVLGVGVDALVKDGLLNKLKQGPLFWIDTADKQPCIGTGGMISWKIKAEGKLFHSGLAHKAINPLELAMEALKEVQLRFYRDFPPHPKEEVYGFATPSTMKPTQWRYPGGGISQIPAECTISGDVRLTPFYEITDVAKKLQEYIDDINANIEKLDSRGPVSKYVLPDEHLRGRLTISFDEAPVSGVACNLDSRGFHVLCKATKDVVGHVKPYSITGSLPLIRGLQDEGFDVQTAGYGLMATYHAKNEYCLLTDMCQGFQVFVSIISQLEADK